MWWNLHILRESLRRDGSQSIAFKMGSVLIDISRAKDYEIIREFSLRCLFFNQRGKEELK
jgi:hypothetical protein